MSNGFTKLASKIIHSSIWNEPHSTRIVWVTMLAMCDEDGIVLASVGGLAKASRVSDEEARIALTCFQLPDPDSSDPDHQGRRIEQIRGGWRLLNYRKYRADKRVERTNLQSAIRMQKYRKRIAKDSTANSPKESTQTASPRRGFVSPTIEETKLHAAKLGLPDSEADKFFAYYEANGWKTGGNPMKNWHAAMSGWKLRWEERRSKESKTSRDTETPAGALF